MLLFLYVPLSAKLGSFTAWQGDQAYRSGDLETARARYEDAASASDMPALYNFGKVGHPKRYGKAFKAFDEVADLLIVQLFLKSRHYLIRAILTSCKKILMRHFPRTNRSSL